MGREKQGIVSAGNGQHAEAGVMGGSMASAGTSVDVALSTSEETELVSTRESPSHKNELNYQYHRWDCTSMWQKEKYHEVHMSHVT
jgi:hypothetical protein